MSEPVEILSSPPAGAVGTSACGCGEHSTDIPVLDTRTIPHAVRHGAIFGAFDQVGPTGSLIVVASHAPLPLLAQLAQRAPHDIEWLEEGPEVWRLRVNRKG